LILACCLIFASDFSILSPNFCILLPFFLHQIVVVCQSIYMEFHLVAIFFTLDPTWLLFHISQIQCGCLWFYYSWFDSVTSFQASTNKHIDQTQKIASWQIDILELLKSSQLCHIEKLKKKTHCRGHVKLCHLKFWSP
jgi:hypothetical protein